MATICEECDESKAVKYCSLCGQKLCSECDLRIHNKGKRALHVRADLSICIKEHLLNTKERQILCKQEIFSHGELKVNVLQFMALPEDKESLDFKRLHTVALEYYIKEAYEGNLMHIYDDFKTNVLNAFQNQFGLQSKYDLDELFSRLKDNNIFHITVRKFGDSKPLLFISLLLTSISHEVIVWILLSIKNDKMKPSEKLILSRIKEYFLLKVNQKDWNTAVEAFYTNPDLLLKTYHLPEIVIFDDKEEKDNISRCQLTVKSETEHCKEEKNSCNYRFEIKGDKWDYEDVIEIDEQENTDWDNFKIYIDNFFGEETSNSPNDSRSKLKKQKNNRNIQKWLSSVETALSKPSNSLSSNHSLQKILNEQSISRAIPGGKYGCALMIKLTGPLELSSLSLGKLCSFVQKALNLNILIYYKTLLIRNNQFDTSSLNASSEAKNAKKISILKGQILSLLKENKGGLSLAQIPLLLKNKYKKSYNIQSLGFPKLKNLLATMDEIDLEKTQGNLLKAVLKTHIRKNSEKPLEEPIKNNLAGKKFLTLRNNPLEHRLNNLHYSSNLHGNFFDSQEPMTHHSKACRTVSTLEDYILKIQSTILEILRSNIFGIEVEKLKNELDRWLGVEFNFRIAGAETFQEFLINNLGDYLDIEVKKSLRIAKSSGPLIHIVYPKNYKLPQQNKQYFIEDHTDLRLNDEFSNVSPSSIHQYMHSPDASFVNCMKPFIGQKDQSYDLDNFKTSQSFNVGKKDDKLLIHHLDSLSQQGGSTGGDLANSCKSTTSQNQYSHFGKLKVLKNSKATVHEFKHGGVSIKPRESTRHIKQKTAPQAENEWNSNIQETGRFAGNISFEKAGGTQSQFESQSTAKQTEEVVGQKSAEGNDDLNEAQSQKVLDRLFADEE